MSLLILCLCATGQFGRLGGAPDRGPAAQITPAIIEAMIESLAAPEPEERRNAADTLGENRVSDPRVIAGLIKLAGDVDERCRDHGVRALGRIGPDAKAAVPTLINLYKTDPSTRRTSLYALAMMSTASKEAEEFLVAIVRGAPNGPTRPLAFGILEARLIAASEYVNNGSDPTPVVPVLIDLLNFSARDVDAYHKVYEKVGKLLATTGDAKAKKIFATHRSGSGLRSANQYVLKEVITVADTCHRTIEQVERERETKPDKAVPADKPNVPGKPKPLRPVF